MKRILDVNLADWHSGEVLDVKANRDYNIQLESLEDGCFPHLRHPNPRIL